MSRNNLLKRAKNIRTILLDVDGVLTDGGIIFSAPNATKNKKVIIETKKFSVRDGTGIRLALKEGFKVGFITGRSSRVVAERAKDLGVKIVVQGAHDKAKAFSKVLKKIKEKPQNIAYIGDDIQDLPILKKVGLSACPKDAHDEVKQRCHFISAKPGGSGAARELIELILKAQGRWERILSALSASGADCAKMRRPL